MGREDTPAVPVEVVQQLRRMTLVYLAGSIAAASVLAIYLAASDFPQISIARAFGALLFAQVVSFVAIAIFSLPTYILCRGALSGLRLTDPFSFSVFGALNAYGLVSLLMGADTLALYLEYPPDPAIAVAGAVGGLACWWAEQQLAGQAV